MFGLWRGSQLLERIVEHPIFTTSRIFGGRPKGLYLFGFIALIEFKGWNPTGIRTGRFLVKAFRKGPSILRWAGDSAHLNFVLFHTNLYVDPLPHTRSRYIFGGKYKTDEVTFSLYTEADIFKAIVFRTKEEMVVQER